MEEHVGQLETALGLLEEHHFFIKLAKCEFVQEELEYLGHIISENGVKVDRKKIETMVDCVGKWCAAEGSEVSGIREGCDHGFQNF